jgi:hypothetical protein
MSASQTLDSSGSKVAVGGDLPRKMFWHDKAGRGWYWESEDLGEHRLFSRSGDLAACLNERGGKWVLTWPRVFPVQQADTEGAAGCGAPPALLSGRIFDAAGNRMSSSHTNKGGVRYRYYISQGVHGAPGMNRGFHHSAHQECGVPRARGG